MVSAKRTAVFGRALGTVDLSPFGVDPENSQGQFQAYLPERVPGV
jgi:hypothetical protein